MAAVNAALKLQIDATVKSAKPKGVLSYKLDQVAEELNLIPGTAALGQADLAFIDTRTLAGSATEDLDLAGVLADSFGATITLAQVVLIFIKAAKTNVNDVLVGNASTNGFVGPIGATGVQRVKAGEFLLWASSKGWAVTGGTGDKLKIANSGAGTAAYDIVVFGRSAAVS